MLPAQTLQATSLRLVLIEDARNLARFRPLRVVLVRRRIEHRAVVIEDISCRNRQLPALISVGERQIDERPPVHNFLRRWDTISQPKFLCELIPGIREQRKAQLVLIVHKERLLHGLRGNGDERCSRLLNLRQNEIHGFHLPHAKRAPAPADEAEDKTPFKKQFGGRNNLAIVILQLEAWRLGADRKNGSCEIFLLEFSNNLSVNRLRLGRNIPGDQFLALSENIAQGSDFCLRARLFERTPLHRGRQELSKNIGSKSTRAFLSTHRSNWELDTGNWQLIFYIPGIFIPASLRAKLGLPICLNIFFICAYWRRRLFTSCTVVPDPRAMRLRRLPLITS